MLIKGTDIFGNILITHTVMCVVVTVFDIHVVCGMVR